MLEIQAGILLAMFGVASYQDMKKRYVMDGIWIIGLFFSGLVYLVSAISGIDYDWYGALGSFAVYSVALLGFGYLWKKGFIGTADMIALIALGVVLPVFYGWAFPLLVMAFLIPLVGVAILTMKLKTGKVSGEVAFCPLLLLSIVAAIFFIYWSGFW